MRNEGREERGKNWEMMVRGKTESALPDMPERRSVRLVLRNP